MIEGPYIRFGVAAILVLHCWLFRQHPNNRKSISFQIIIKVQIYLKYYSNGVLQTSVKSIHFQGIYFKLAQFENWYRPWVKNRYKLFISQKSLICGGNELYLMLERLKHSGKITLIYQVMRMLTLLRIKIGIYEHTTLRSLWLKVKTVYI